MGTNLGDGAGAVTAECVLRLYVAGSTRRSTPAVECIKALCEARLKGRYVLEVVDLYQQPGLARADHVIVTPTLIKERPRPPRRVTGDLSNPDRVLCMVATDLTERRRHEAALLSSLLNKEALLKEVHHRVKNNPPVISSLLGLEARRSGEGNVKNVLGGMQHRIQAMALLHEMLYRAGDVARIDLAAYLGKLASRLMSSLATPSSAVEIRVDLATAVVDLDQAIPCSLLVSELVSNCLKHAFPGGRGGEVRIVLQPVARGPQFRLAVTDTGVGLPADLDARRERSLGLQLVTDLAQQMGGALETSLPGQGTAVGVTFTPRHLDRMPTAAPEGRAR